MVVYCFGLLVFSREVTKTRRERAKEKRKSKGKGKEQRKRERAEEKRKSKVNLCDFVPSRENKEETENLCPVR